MKRIVVCAALLATALPSSAAATDRVDGAGVNGGRPAVNAFFLSAQSANDGSAPKGTVSYVDPQRLRVLHGDVTCLNVEDRVANVVFRYRTTFNQPVGFGAVGNLTRIQDNGSVSGGGFADLLSNGYLRNEGEYAAALARCLANAPLPPREVRITAGNLTVVDDGP